MAERIVLCPQGLRRIVNDITKFGRGVSDQINEDVLLFGSLQNVWMFNNSNRLLHHIISPRGCLEHQLLLQALVEASS